MSAPSVAGAASSKPRHRGQDRGFEDATPTNPLAPASTAVEFHYTQSDNFVALLQELNLSLLVTTYQANKLLVIRAAKDHLSTLVRTFDQPMGLTADRQRLTLATRTQIWMLRNAPDIAPRLEPLGVHDGCYLPRSCHVTGDIRVHEIAWASDVGRIDNPSYELWIVNTRFSCLCTLDPDYSFVPRWRPAFISALAAEDRCHLNGLTLIDEKPKYVTALGNTDTPGGWRPNKAQGGCLIDVPSGEILLGGLCMPHSPRWHDGWLWVLESGTGRLLIVEPATGRGESVAELPGYVRGLALCGPYAFVGLSKFRETSTFGCLPLAERVKDLKCGVAVVDLRHGQIMASLEFQTAVEEIFDVQLLPGIRFPEVIGFQKETVQHTFIIPAEATGSPPVGGSTSRNA
jgi:uncharacterized protein (TIGR03032 family)